LTGGADPDPELRSGPFDFVCYVNFDGTGANTWVRAAVGKITKGLHILEAVLGEQAG
jgi:hypothetical protein